MQQLSCTACGAQVTIEDWYLDLFGPMDKDEALCESCLQAERAQHFCRTMPVIPPVSWLAQE